MGFWRTMDDIAVRYKVRKNFHDFIKVMKEYIMKCLMATLLIHFERFLERTTFLLGLRQQH